MAARTYRRLTPFEQTPPARRASGLVLAIGLNLLVLLALLGIGAFDPVPMRGSPIGTIVVDLADAVADCADQPEEKPQQQQQPERAATPPPPSEPLPPPVTVVPEAPKIAPARPLDMIELSREEYRAADIATMPRAPSGGPRAGDSKEAGRGPNGEVLYAAEWAREPTDAELGGYLPANARGGYGVVACRTVAGNRVDDCIELESGPRGSRLASAVRQAAWQFRVRPPRKNGRPMVGEWVVIRIDYEVERGL